LNEIILPTLEFTDLYERNVGETSDVVKKEMYTMKQEGKNISLRPEGTAGVIRSFVEKKCYVSPNETNRFYYSGSMFRKERPQAGRQREFTQLGAEIIGSIGVEVEAEMMLLMSDFLMECEIDAELQLNYLGCKECQKCYFEELKKWVEKKDDLCLDCLERKEKNVLRILDCKNEKCGSKEGNIPLMKDTLCKECLNEFSYLKEILKELDVAFVENDRMVRGLDYYSKTVFEFVDKSIGAQSSIAGGGRYENLVKEMGGPNTVGFGFAFGLERIILSMKNKKSGMEGSEPALDYYLIWTNEKAKIKQMKIAKKLREKGFRAEMDFFPKKMKKQLKTANRKGAKWVVIIGESEEKNGLVQLKNMETGGQKTCSWEDFFKKTSEC
jgi:histidyl-tRNA synthetase